jgi:hypothetical protein
MVLIIGFRIDVALASAHVSEPSTFIEMAHHQGITARIARSNSRAASSRFGIFPEAPFALDYPR